MGFTLYFNAVYVIRKWVIMINIAVAPLVIWIWVLSEKREVIEIWLAEIIQTIFMQTFHALAFGVVFSILYCPAALPTLSFETAASAGTAFIGLGRVIAYFAGVICAGVIVFQCYHIICAINDEQRAAAQTTLGRSLIGLLIIGLSLMITTYLVGDGNMPLFYPDPTGATVVSDLTLWELFFAILTIIPVAKMLSTMFMSLLSRAAIVNEEAVAGKAMAGLAGLALLGRSSMGAVRGGGGSLPNHTTAPPGGGDRKVLNPPVPQGYDPATGGGSSPGSAYAQTMSQLGGADHQRMANNFQGKGRAAGMISGIAAGPATGAMLGGAFGAVAKTAGTMGYTGKAMASGLQLMSKNNEVKNIPLNERAQDFTGRQSAVGAWTQMGAGVILSPLGPKVSSGVSQGFGWTIDRGLGMIDALASRA
ncbi:MAG: hypothetical protein GXY49_14300 [Syntrophomonadaceae bacterium]|nr:hypothetical protein [Syntrophomonadaceae bacterium]